MNICEIAFSTDWFLTIPGILITCGVILLIIALIMLLMSSAKGKKSEPNVQQTSTGLGDINGIHPSVPNTGVAVSNMDSVSSSTTSDLNMGESVIDAVPSVSATLDAMAPTLEPVATLDTPTDGSNLNQATSSQLPTVDPVQPAEAQAIPTLGSLSSIPTIPSVAEVPVVETPPAVDPIVSAETVVEPSTSQTENMNAFDALSTSGNAYGGAPVIPEIKPVEESRPIYGGANPMESATQPTVVEEHHEPYSGGLNTSEAIDAPTIGPVPVLEPAERSHDVVSTPNSDIVTNVEEASTIVNNVPEVPVLDTPTTEENVSASSESEVFKSEVTPTVSVPTVEEPTVPTESQNSFIPKVELNSSSTDVEEL